MNNFFLLLTISFDTLNVEFGLLKFLFKMNYFLFGFDRVWHLIFQFLLYSTNLKLKPCSFTVEKSFVFSRSSELIFQSVLSLSLRIRKTNIYKEIPFLY